MNRQLLGTTGCVLLAALGLSACGGGGGGSRPAPIAAPQPTPTPAPPPPPPAPSSINYNTAEYQRSNGAAAAGAIKAYEAGATGKGVKAGVVDSGINSSLSEFAGRIDPASRDVAGSRGVSDEDGHGTAVSAVIAANRDGSNMHGVAFDSTIVSFRADRPGSCAETGDDGGCKFHDGAIASGVDGARLAGAKVINLSLGGSTPSSTLLSAMRRAVDAGIVLVISAGNDGEKPEGANADPFALIPAQNFPGQVIIAGSVGADDGLGGTNLDAISAFSNRAGNGRAYYLTALGYRVRAPNHEGTQYLWNGTSFSAPVISGAVALLAQAFPNLTAQQMVRLLFETADDLGAPGVDSVYGNGRLNLTRAFQPAGKTSMAGSETPVDAQSNGDLPGAAGDAGEQGPLGVVILDGYSRAFALDLARTLKAAEPDRPLARALSGNVRIAGAAAGPLSIAMSVAERRDLPQGVAVERLGIGPDDARRSRLIAGSAVARIDEKTAAALGFAEGAKAMERKLTGAQSGAFLIARDVAASPGFDARRSGSMALRRSLGPVAVTMSAESGSVWTEVATSATGSPYSLTSIAVDRKVGRNWLSAGISRLDEKNSLLGGRMGEALGGGGSTSLFLDLEARRDLGSGFSLGLNARRGWTDFTGGSFRSGAYGLDLEKAGLLTGGDRLGLRLSQPLRIEKGGFSMLLPTGYDYATGTADRSVRSFSLSPRGRELDAELSYSTGLWGGWLGGNLYVRREPGHMAGAEDDLGAAVRYSLGF